jgi:hypothetical protein
MPANIAAVPERFHRVRIGIGWPSTLKQTRIAPGHFRRVPLSFEREFPETCCSEIQGFRNEAGCGSFCDGTHAGNRLRLNRHV